MKFTSLLLTAQCVLAVDRLQIGILRKVPDCQIKARPGDAVHVDYVGTLEDGTEFDNSYKRGRPIPFTLGSGQVISGWDQGVTGMCLGEKRKLTIPPHLAYGDSGAGPIPPDSTLVFTVELVGLNSEMLPKKEDSEKEDL